MLFNEYSLRCMLLKTGFETIKVVKGPSAVKAMFEASYSITDGESPYFPKQLTLKQRISITFYKMIELVSPASSEVITIVAKKAI